MKMKDLLNKNAVLFTLALCAVYHANTAVAYDPRLQRNQPPSIEINLDALDNISGANGASAESPFGEPTSATHPLKKGKTAKHKTKKHGKSAQQKSKPPKVVKNKPNTAPEIRVTPAPQEKEEVPVMVTIPEREKPHQAQGTKEEKSPAPVKPNPLPEIESLPLGTLPALPEKKTETAPPAAPALPPLSPASPAHALPKTAAPVPVVDTTAKELLPLPSATAAKAPPALPVLPDNKMEALPLPIMPPTPSAAPASPPLPPSDVVPNKATVSPPLLPPVLPPVSDEGKGADKPVAAGVAKKQTGTPDKKEAGDGAEPSLRIVFNENETELPLSMTGKLDVIAAQLIKNPSLLASIVAYASGSEAISIYPKRVSLARGIAVRNYLTTSKNIDVERVTVKALGNKNGDGPPNRVDIFIIK